MQYDAGDVNLYRFVGNEPMTRLDPEGLCLVDISQQYNDLITSYNGGTFNLAFVSNFLCRGGDKTLNDLGALGIYKGTSAFIAMRAKVMKDVRSCEKNSGGKSFSGQETDTQKDLFSIGKHSLKTNYSCSEDGTCKVTYKFKDRFNDPKNLWEDYYSNYDIDPSNPLYGPDGLFPNFIIGKPYDITETWDETVSRKCCKDH